MSCPKTFDFIPIKLLATRWGNRKTNSTILLPQSSILVKRLGVDAKELRCFSSASSPAIRYIWALRFHNFFSVIRITTVMVFPEHEVEMSCGKPSAAISRLVCLAVSYAENNSDVSSHVTVSVCPGSIRFMFSFINFISKFFL